MTAIQLLHKPEDYKRLGINPDAVEPWEDGRRETDEPGHSEVWYFDAILSDGSTLVFGVRAAPMLGEDVEASGPLYSVIYTTADGSKHTVEATVPADNAHLGTEKCDLELGGNSIVGDLAEYDVHFEPEETADGGSLGVDLHLSAEVKPYRPGTGYITVDDGDREFYLTFMCTARLSLTGTVTLDGETREIAGAAYENRQWTNHYTGDIWHHWLWGRQNTGDYTVTIYDLVGAERYGFTRIPLFCVDDKDGNRIFESNGDLAEDQVTVEVLDKSLQPETGKVYPKTTRYTFRDGDTTIGYTVTWKKEIDILDHYAKATDKAKARYDRMGIRPTYTRYHAEAELEITRGGETVTSTDDMIYELNYPGAPDPRGGF